MYEDAGNEFEEKANFYKLSCDMRWKRGKDGDGNKLRGCPEAPRVGAEGSQSHSLFTLTIIIEL